MAQISNHQIVSAYHFACKKHGEHPAATEMAARLLSAIIEQETAYTRSSERKTTEAEKDYSEIVGDLGPDGSEK